MKLLTLIRHAKSDWADHSLPDHDRPLNERGKKAAPEMGRILAGKGIKPDAVISSTAVRALATAKVIAPELGIETSAIMQVSDIYAAGVPALLQVVNGLDEDLQDVILIGHNPGIEDLANTLLPGEPIEHLPTCAVVRIQLNVDHWGQAGAKCGKLIEHLYPKMFEE